MNMGIRFKAIGSLFVLLVAGTAFQSKAIAESQTPAEAFERTYFKNDRNFYDNGTVFRQLDWMFGFRNSFPESEIARDAEAVNNLFHDTLQQQVGNDPYIRTPDLPTPYTSSVMSSPRLNMNKLRTGTEFRFENTPPR
jgi:hypothetical protein